VEELMADAPENEACIKFADYVLEHFVLPTCNYPPSTWAATPDTVGKRTNNGTESVHSQTRRDYIASMGYKFSARTDL
jgi:hypothetical protein